MNRRSGSALLKEKTYYLDFTLRKIHSLFGILPLGLFITEHMLINFTALYGAHAYNRAVEILHSFPLLWVLEVFLIALPLTFHALLGIYIAWQARNNHLKYGYWRNWAFYLQRLTGLFVFFFVIYHVLNLKFNPALSHLSMYEKVIMQFNSLTGVILYALGLTATLFHFINGLWGFMVNWGILRGTRAQKIWGYALVFIFLMVNLAGLRMMGAFMP